MSGPWEKYAKGAQPADVKPWEKYAKGATSPENTDPSQGPRATSGLGALPVIGDAADAAVDAWRTLKGNYDRTTEYNRSRANGGPMTLADEARGFVQGPRTLLDIANLGIAPLTAAVTRPASRAMAALPIVPNRPGTNQPMTRGETAQMWDANLNQALMGVRPGPGRLGPAAGVQPPPRAPAIPKGDLRVAAALERAAIRDGVTPQDLAAQARANPGVPAFQAAGDNMAGLAEVAAKSPGSAQTAIRSAVRTHQAQAGDRIKTAVGEAMGGKGDYFATLDSAKAAREAKFKPLIDRAFAEPIDAEVYRQTLEPLITRRLPKGALEQAYEIARKEGINPEEIGLIHMDTFNGYQAGGRPIADINRADFNALRRGVEPNTSQGESLLGFIAKNGGVRDLGGELSSMDAQSWHRNRAFMPKLIKDTGLTMEDMAQRAYEAGYFPDIAPPTMEGAGNMQVISGDDLLGAIRREMGGQPAYARPVNDANQLRGGRLDDMERRFQAAGIDPRRTSPEQAAEIMGQFYDDMARNEAFASGPPPGMSPNEPVYVQNPSMKTLHYIKKGIDQTLEQYRNPVTRELNLSGSPGAQADAQVRSALGQTMRRINPDYDEAMKVWGDDSEHINALELGRNVFSNKFDMQAENLKKIVGGMSEQAKDMYRKGIGEALIAQVRSAKGGVGTARQLLKSEDFADRVRLAVPDNVSFDDFVAKLEREVAMQDRNNRVLGGSPTYPLQAARAELEGQQGVDALDALAGAIDTGLSPGRMGAAALRQLIKSIPRRDRSIIADPAMNEALGRALTDPDEMTRLLNLLELKRAQRSRPAGGAAARGPAPMGPAPGPALQGAPLPRLGGSIYGAALLPLLPQKPARPKR